jgi:DNA-binding transcriptional MerR regulator
MPEARKLPRWDDLPDFGLYMDQVISLMERYLGTPAGTGEKRLTASMVNNYVKIGAIPSPIKKKYGREHLACLVVVCALKPVLPLAVIREILSNKLEQDDPSELYEQFCQQFEAAEREALDAVAHDDDAAVDPHAAVVASALSAQARRNVALTYWASRGEQ